MKRFSKALLVMVLAIAMVLNTCGIVLAGGVTAPTVTVTEEVVNAETGIKKLVFTLTTPAGSAAVTSTGITMSYDNTVIQPVKKSGTNADVTITSDSTTQDPFKAYVDAALSAEFDFSNNFSIAGVKYKVKDGRTGFYIDTNNSNGVDASEGLAITEFYFRVIEGKTPNSETFKFETDYSEDSIYAALRNDANTAFAFAYGVKGSSALNMYGTPSTTDVEAIARPSVTYTGSDILVLGSLEIAPLTVSGITVPTVYDADGATGNTAATLALSATATSTIDTEMDVPADAEWKITNTTPIEGVSISGTGANATLTVAPGAFAGTATIVVSSGTVSATTGVVITRAESIAPTAMKLYAGGDEITSEKITVVKPANSETKNVVFTAEVFDQYGGKISTTSETVVFSVDAADLTIGITFANNTLSLTKEASDCNIDVSAAFSGVTKTFSVEIVGLVVNWDEVTVADSITYGDTNASAVTLPSAGTASVDGTVVNGEYSVVDAEAIQNAGSATVTVKFTADADEGDYAGVEITKDYEITVNKADYDMSKIAAATQISTYTGSAIDYIESNITKPDDVTVTEIVYNATPVNVDDYTATISFETSDANYNNPVDVEATLTVEKATATAFETDAPVINTNAQAYVGTTLADTKANLPATASVLFGGNATEEVTMTWADATQEFSAKGGTYTFVGTPSSDNLDLGSLTLVAALNIAAVTAELENAIPDVFIKKAFLEGEKVSYADVNLPHSIKLILSNGGELTYVDAEDTTSYAGRLTWNKTLEELCALNIGDVVDVTVTTEFPEWLTFDGDLTASFEVTEKDPVTVTVTQANGVYGTALAAPEAALTDAGYGVEAEPTYDYTYAGTTAGGEAYASADAPTEAGTYTVTATIVSDTYAGSGSVGFEIAPLAITATIGDATKVYGDANPVDDYTYSAVGVIGEDELDVTYNCAATETSAVGTYDITAVADNKNYTVTWTNGTLTVNPKDLAETDFIPVIGGTVEIGTALTASVAGLAADQYTIQWYVDGSEVAEATTRNYTPVIADSGKNVTVKILGINNYTGDVTSESVTVPKYEIEGSIAIVFETDNGVVGTIDATDVMAVDTTGIANYSALIDAGISLEYIWKIDGTEKARGTTYTVPAETTGVLTVEVATAVDGNFVGSIESGSAEINKVPLTGAITLTAAEGVVSIGENTVSGTEGTDYDVIWTIDGEELTLTEGAYTVTSADYGKTVTVKAVAKGDAYTGVVVATYAIPAIAPSNVVISTTAGATSITVTVTADANGATISGYAIAIVDGESYTGAANSYTFEGLTTSTTYTITATATNSAGTSEAATATAVPFVASSSGLRPSYKPTATPDSGDDEGTGTDSEDEGTTTSDAEVTVKVEDTTASIDKEILADKESVEVTTETESGTAVTTTVDVADASVESLEVSTNDSDKEAAGAAAEGAVGTPVEVKVDAKDAEGNKVDVTVNVAIPSEEKAYAYIIDENGVATRTESAYNEETGEVEVANVPDGAVVMLSTTAPATFDDADDHWAEDTINYAVDAGIMNGVGGGAFDPDGEATRGMVNAMMVRLAKVIGAELAEAADQKVDTDAEHWAAATDLIALANGWTNGVRTLEDGTVVMNTDATVTREQLVTMLWRFVEHPEAEGDITTFDDHHETSDWAKEAKAWAVGAGIINGKPGNVLDPNGTATRAEIATMFQRLMAYMTK